MGFLKRPAAWAVVVVFATVGAACNSDRMAETPPVSSAPTVPSVTEELETFSGDSLSAEGSAEEAVSSSVVTLPTTTQPAPTTTRPAVVAQGPPAPAVTLTLDDGSQFVLADAVRPVLFVFWAEW